MERATEIARTVNPLRANARKMDYRLWTSDRTRSSAEMKYWMELIGMVGGPVRVCVP